MTNTLIALSFVTLPLIAQAAGGVDAIWKVAVQFGFNAGLVVFLLWLQRDKEKTIYDRADRRAQQLAELINELTAAVTNVTLGNKWLPDNFHEHAKETKRRSEEILKTPIDK